MLPSLKKTVEAVVGKALKPAEEEGKPRKRKTADQRVYEGMTQSEQEEYDQEIADVKRDNAVIDEIDKMFKPTLKPMPPIEDDESEDEGEAVKLGKRAVDKEERAMKKDDREGKKTTEKEEEKRQQCRPQ